ncbi:MAG: RnfABCDGE type electron transport complex subunit D [Lachnospiraceae bacterium]|nr:RnfABCDGE type electron transport complex subunit D [Lachnospiraceae bacterium]
MNENSNLRISFYPHIRDKASTSRIMLDVAISLLPATIFGVFNFGWYALLLILVCVGTCVILELIWDLGNHKRMTIRDLSAVVTGMILALNLPPTLPLWMAAVGAAFAIVIVKLLFGGLGQNIMNPAACAKCFLMICFATRMNMFVYQGVLSTPPIEVLRAGGTVDLLQLFLGNTSGCIGETCAVALIIGAIYLFIRRIIDFRIPLFFLIAAVIYIGIYSLFTRGGIDMTLIGAHLLSGGMLLGAFFMATDYVTSPVSRPGRIIYGAFIGALVCTFRLFGTANGSVCFAILLGNLVVPLIERITRRKSFGKEE